MQAFFDWLQGTWLATQVSENYFPLVESIHVIAVGLVFGTILIVDLRLLNLASRSLRVSYLSEQVLPWTWRAFVLAVVTGLLMFVANAQHYFENTPFRIKLLLMVLAGLNMAVFQFGTFRRVAQWDLGWPTTAARAAGATSLLLWVGVITAGRWIDFV